MKMSTITPVGWNDFQHYKDRSPSWIKLHRKYLDDYSFHSMQDASKALAPMLWLLASEYDGGQIPFDLDMLAFRLRTSKEKLAQSVKELIDKGFFDLEQDASELLAECLPREEKRREEKERETEGESMSGKPDDAAEVLDFLNVRTKSNYRAVSSNLEKIRARLNEGATVDEMKAVIDRKAAEWLTTTMEKYLRPETLFNATKYNQYVGQLSKPILKHGMDDRMAQMRIVADELTGRSTSYDDDADNPFTIEAAARRIA